MTLAVAGEAERGFGSLRLEPLKNKTFYFFILQLKLQRLLVTRCECGRPGGRVVVGHNKGVVVEEGRKKCGIRRGK